MRRPRGLESYKYLPCTHPKHAAACVRAGVRAGGQMRTCTCRVHAPVDTFIDVSMFACVHACFVEKYRMGERMGERGARDLGGERARGIGERSSSRSLSYS